MYTTHLLLTVFVFVAALLIVARMVILEKRPRDDINPRLIPTTTVLMVSAFVALLALIHLLNLIGINTARR
jgi:hypothetical protein